MDPRRVSVLFVYCDHAIHPHSSEAEGFFNLLFAHIFTLHPSTSPEANRYTNSLLKTIATSSSDRLSIKYRVYVSFLGPFRAHTY